MTPTRDIYFEVSLKSLKRLLSQLDRQPFSDSAGSWHRAYWHQRLSDFSSGACQQGVLALALLYRLERDDNPLRGNATVLRWVESSIRYLLTLQHRDGSFDEWYPNERGWAGPTAYLVYALVKTWSLVGERLPAELAEQVKDAAYRACRFLMNFEEPDVLGNHQAMAVLAAAVTGEVFPSPELPAIYESLLKRLVASTQDEGWSLEYDGADPGYQTATLSFLARVHRINGDERIKTMVGPMLDFVAHFFFGARSFAGTIGSRSTRNLFHLGFEYWAHHFELSETLAAQSREMLAQGVLLEPGDQEDHYLIYRVQEFLEACELAKPEARKHALLPCDRSPFRRSFEKAGILCVRGLDHYTVMNLRKGGALKCIVGGEKVFEDSGWMLRKGRRALLTNSYLRHDHEIRVSGSEARVSGIASRYRQPLFTPWSFIGFRLAVKTLGIFPGPGPARWFKRWIRSRIMTSRAADRSVQFTRLMTIRDDGIELDDRVTVSKGAEIGDVWLGGGFQTRTVPQSRYFEAQDLSNAPVELDPEALSRFRESGVLESRRSFR